MAVSWVRDWTLLLVVGCVVGSRKKMNELSLTYIVRDARSVIPERDGPCRKVHVIPTVIKHVFVYYMNYMYCTFNVHVCVVLVHVVM